MTPPSPPLSAIVTTRSQVSSPDPHRRQCPGPAPADVNTSKYCTGHSTLLTTLTPLLHLNLQTLVASRLWTSSWTSLITGHIPADYDLSPLVRNVSNLPPAFLLYQDLTLFSLENSPLVSAGLAEYLTCLLLTLTIISLQAGTSGRQDGRQSSSHGGSL